MGQTQNIESFDVYLFLPFFFVSGSSLKEYLDMSVEQAAFHHHH
jgi:hypothetical protein